MRPLATALQETPAPRGRGEASRLRRAWPRSVGLCSFLVLALLLSLEGMLRLQQRLGPLYDLEFKPISLEKLSDVLNHRPVVADTYIQGTETPVSFDDNGIRVETQRPDFSKVKGSFRILFMGDSFMQGYDDRHTIPQHVWDSFQKTRWRTHPLALLNAGCASYSPAIYIPQARRLVPLLHPNAVVIDIHSTR